MNSFSIDRFLKIDTLLNTKNDWSHKMGTRITKSERAFFVLLEFFKSKLFSKLSKIKLYTLIIRSILTYSCEVWITTSIT